MSWRRKKDHNKPKMDKHTKYPDKPKIVANPRNIGATDQKLLQQGIRTIQYVYSFGIIGYKFESIDNEMTPIYLIIQHKYNKEWGFPKGHFEKGKESPYGYDTAKREFEEESGLICNIDIVSIDWNNPYIQQYDFQRKNKLCKKWTVLFAAQIANQAKPKIIRPKEIKDIQWMTIKQFNQKNIHKENMDTIKHLNAKLIQSLKPKKVDDEKNNNDDETEK